MRWWKWVGLAGLVGVATTAGVIAVKRSRARTWTEYTPEEMRDRLHERLAGSASAAAARAAGSIGAEPRASEAHAAAGR